MSKKTIEDINVSGLKCLVRVDFNVPMQDGVITDLNRIEGAIPTIKYLCERGAKVILCSHMGRPKGEFNKKYTLKPVAIKLAEMLGKPVAFAEDVIGPSAEEKVASCKNGEIVLLENLRFHKEEEENEKEFCRKLASFCDVYVNDAFGTAHRAHASTAGIVQYGFVKTAVAGFLIGKEISIMGGALENPKRPFVAILGGAKVSDKIAVINNLLDKVDTVIIGGGMAYTFLAAQGYAIGNSICERDKFDLALELIKKAKDRGVKLLLPVDDIYGSEFSNNAATLSIIVSEASRIPDGWMGMDIGFNTRELFAQEIKQAKTVIWNGPMGVFEFDKFAGGTKAVAKAMAESDAITIIGGGDSASAVAQLGYGNRMTHISTGGGASLEYLEGKDLPGISCLDNK